MTEVEYIIPDHIKRGTIERIMAESLISKITWTWEKHYIRRHKITKDWIVEWLKTLAQGEK